MLSVMIFNSLQAGVGTLGKFAIEIADYTASTLYNNSNTYRVLDDVVSKYIVNPLTDFSKPPIEDRARSYLDDFIAVQDSQKSDFQNDKDVERQELRERPTLATGFNE